MSLHENRHPLYAESLEDWMLMRDSLSERLTKNATVKYLPATYGMKQRGMEKGKEGYEEYQSYLIRAIYYEIVPMAVSAMVGVLNKKRMIIEVPSRLEPMLDNFTKRGHSIYSFNRKLNEAQLLQGRMGMLVDIPEKSDVNSLPYIVPYSAMSITNWDDFVQGEPDSLKFVVLDESRQVISDEDYSWEREERYKVLKLDKGKYVTYDEIVGKSVSKELTPSLANRSTAGIPFVFCGSNDTDASPDKIPLLSLARIGFAIYRGDADYRYSLFMQGQDTLFTKGGKGKVQGSNLSGDKNGHVNVEDYLKVNDIEVGAGAHIHIVDTGGDAKYIGVNSNGLPEQRLSLEKLHELANKMGLELLSNTGRAKEAAEALKIRLLAESTSLTQVAQTAAQALEQALKFAAQFKGLNPDEVSVEPNLDFADISVTADEVNKLIDATIKNFPLSQQSLHAIAVKSGLTDKTYEKEMDEKADAAGDTIPIRPGASAAAEPDDAE